MTDQSYYIDHTFLYRTFSCLRTAPINIYLATVTDSESQYFTICYINQNQHIFV